MKPYYQDSAVTIYHGDCRDVCYEIEEIDFVFTSPPYNCGMLYGQHDDLMDSDKYFNFIRECSNSISACTRPGSYQCWNIPNWMGSRPKIYVPDGIRKTVGLGDIIFTDEITWVKGTLEAPQRTSSGWGNFPTSPCIVSASEPILVFRKTGGNPRPVRDMNWKDWCKYVTGVWPIMCEFNQTDHPAKFPIELPSRGIRLYSDIGETILDPFAGSCTTGRAAKNLGRKCVCIEREERFCEIGARKMSQEVLAL